MANKTALTTHSHTRIDLPAHTRAAMGMILNERLADDLDLERQAKQAHWNIRGARFQQLHELFDSTAALAFCANAARADIEEASAADDAITADLLTRITSETDKQLCFVESHLEPEPT